MTQLNDILAFAFAWSEDQMALILEMLRGLHAWSIAAAWDLTARLGIELPDRVVLFAVYGSFAVLFFA
ncbi:hypothetical protein, partial [Limimaricola soesokkakensis]|uniref:hypothetical protein n=1 Tax=Limimaricola soesokkakensis TaxID=1343159 RepID=UPI0035138DDC